MKDLQSLQSGSDIRGIALDNEEAGAVTLTAEIAQKIAGGIVHWLEKDKAYQTQPLKIVVGQDSRLSGEELKQGLIAGFVASGIEVIDVSLATTPAIFMATKFPEYQCDAGVMITASHLPYYFNGIKIFSKSGGAEETDIAQILRYAKDTEPIIRENGTVIFKELIPVYAQDLVAKIRKGIGTEAQPLKGFHIIVDAGNGAGGFFVKRVLEVLGANTMGSQFLEPDGHFPNHIPNPDNKEAMESIRQAVLKSQADLGVIFDTDVDRAAVVDQAGNVLNRSNLIAVLATIVEHEHPGSAIVTNSPTSSHLKQFIEGLGGKQVRYLSGYRNVINKAIELNKAGIPTELAIETSGHAAFKENYFLDDGAYVIAKILMLLPKLKKEGTTLAQLIGKLQQPLETQEIRFKINAENYHHYGEQVIIDMTAFVQKQAGFEIDPENEEGIRVNVAGPFGQGWFLLRMSLHEPLLVLQIENDEPNGVHKTIQALAEFFEAYAQLDTAKLTGLLV